MHVIAEQFGQTTCILHCRRVKGCCRIPPLGHLCYPGGHRVPQGFTGIIGRALGVFSAARAGFLLVRDFRYDQGGSRRGAGPDGGLPARRRRAISRFASMAARSGRPVGVGHRLPPDPDRFVQVYLQARAFEPDPQRGTEVG